jgi:hypothetical protein
MADCYNFTINATNKYINYCLNKCIKNNDDYDYYNDYDYYDDYNKGARGAEALANKGARGAEALANKGARGAEALANKGARGAEALANECYCKCISKLNDNNDGYGDSDGYSDGYSDNNVFTAFFIIIIFLLTFCLYGFIKAKLQTIYATNEINSITIINSNADTNVGTNENANTNGNDNTNRLNSNTDNVNYYTINNSDNTQDLPKYNDIEPNISLPPKYDNTIKSNYTNEMM